MWSFTEHPKSVDETYFTHMKYALRLSGTFIFLTLTSIVHAILPFAFTKTASHKITALAEQLYKRNRKIS